MWAMLWAVLGTSVGWGEEPDWSSDEYCGSAGISSHVVYCSDAGDSETANSIGCDTLANTDGKGRIAIVNSTCELECNADFSNLTGAIPDNRFAICIVDGGTLTVNEQVITSMNCDADMACIGVLSGGTLIVESSSVSGPTDLPMVHAESGATVTITSSSTLTGQTANDADASLISASGAEVTIKDSTLTCASSDDASCAGSAPLIDARANATLTITSSTLTRQAADDADASLIRASGAEVTIKDSTLTCASSDDASCAGSAPLVDAKASTTIKISGSTLYAPTGGLLRGTSQAVDLTNSHLIYNGDESAIQGQSLDLFIHGSLFESTESAPTWVAWKGGDTSITLSDTLIRSSGGASEGSILFDLEGGDLSSGSRELNLTHVTILGAYSKLYNTPLVDVSLYHSAFIGVGGAPEEEDPDNVWLEDVGDALLTTYGSSDSEDDHAVVGDPEGSDLVDLADLEIWPALCSPLVRTTDGSVTDGDTGDAYADSAGRYWIAGVTGSCDDGLPWSSTTWCQEDEDDDGLPSTIDPDDEDPGIPAGGYARYVDDWDEPRECLTLQDWCALGEPDTGYASWSDDAGQCSAYTPEALRWSEGGCGCGGAPTKGAALLGLAGLLWGRRRARAS